jgi:hypothetical protein
LLYCFGVALTLHVAGVLSPLVLPVSPGAVVQPPKPPLFPVALDDPPPSVPPPPPVLPPPEPQEPAPPPAPAEPPLRPAAAVAVAKRPPERPRLPRHERAPSRLPTPEPAPPHPELPEPAEDATAFGGEHGAFQAKVCFVARGMPSAHRIDGCEPVASFSTNAIDVSPRRFRRGFPGVEGRIEWFGIDYRGRFKVRKAGYYTFRLLSDDGALLFVDGAQILDNDGVHSARSVKMALPLSAGEHEFRLLYYQGPGSSIALQLFVKGFQTPERLFGPEF